MFDELNLIIRIRSIKVKAVPPSSFFFKKRAIYNEFRKTYLNFRNYAKYPKVDFT